MARTGDTNFSRIGKDTLIRDPSNSNAVTGGEIAYSPSLTLNDKIDQVASSVINSGSGDMTKLVYDSNNDGVVNNSDQLGGQTLAQVRARSSHTGTQTADTIIDGVTNKAYTAIEQGKLSGIESGAQVLSETNLQTRINALGTKATASVGADSVVIVDSQDSNKIKKFSFTTLASSLASLFGFRNGLPSDSTLHINHAGQETYLSDPTNPDNFLVSGGTGNPNLWKTPTQARSAMLPTQTNYTVLRSNGTDVNFAKVDLGNEVQALLPTSNGGTGLAYNVFTELAWFTAGEGITRGDAIYLDYSTNTAYKCNNSTRNRVDGFSVNTVTSGNTAVVDTSLYGIGVSYATKGNWYQIGGTSGVLSTTTNPSLEQAWYCQADGYLMPSFNRKTISLSASCGAFSSQNSSSIFIDKPTVILGNYGIGYSNVGTGTVIIQGSYDNTNWANLSSYSPGTGGSGQPLSAAGCLITNVNKMYIRVSVSAGNSASASMTLTS